VVLKGHFSLGSNCTKSWVSLGKWVKLDFFLDFIANFGSRAHMKGCFINFIKTYIGPEGPISNYSSQLHALLR
jgi:hypothetical protein